MSPISENRAPLLTLDFLRALPKTDLHVHLDGSLRLSSLLELASEYHVDLPSYTEAGLRELVFKERYQDLGDYLARAAPDAPDRGHVNEVVGRLRSFLN